MGGTSSKRAHGGSEFGGDGRPRLTQQMTAEHNALAARLAARIVVAHVSPNGSLAAQVSDWRQAGPQLEILTDGYQGRFHFRVACFVIFG